MSGLQHPRDAQDLADVEARLVLLGLPGMGPARMRWLVGEDDPIRALERLRTSGTVSEDRRAPSGVKPDTLRAWAQAASATDGPTLYEQHTSSGITVIGPNDADWPFSQDPEPPELLFVLGDRSALLAQPKVGIVGTRRCTSVGRRVATQLGLDLADAGVSVVSGLALGVDGAAHVGALRSARSDAKPIGVVATGLDVVYPKKHELLWGQVGERGLLLSESPLGTKPQRWRFPARNRLLAGIVDLVVVVESHGSGGALSTVDEATARSVDVLVVPGSVLSAASQGTNALLVDGYQPVRDAADVLSLLALSGKSPIPALSKPPLQLVLGGQPPEPALANLLEIDERLLQEISAGGVHLDQLIRVLGGGLAGVVMSVQRLEQAGLVQSEGSLVSLCGDWA